MAVEAIQMSRSTSSSWRIPVGVAASLLLQGLLIPTAAAQDTNAADTAAARALAVEGIKLADGGHCAEALDKLARAEKLHHAPIVLARLGECNVAQGKLVDGTEQLRRVLREPLPANPSPALLKAREHAQSALDGAKPKIGTLAISAKGPEAMVVTIDGQSISSALLGADRPTDPGEHVVEATAPGFLKASKRVTIGVGEKQSVALELQPDPNAPVVSATPSTPANPTPLITSSSRDSAVGADRAETPRIIPPNRTGAYISWAIGGAATIVGAGFGLVAMKGKSDLEKQCPGNVCPTSSQQRLDSATTAGTVSTIGFGVGAAGLVLGTVLFITASPSSVGASEHSSLVAKSQPGLRARAWVGVGQAGFAGEF
jgi:hypothetical protein